MKPLVSICCIVYNQEKYIEKMLESFLMQNTDFDYDILIHDDASTDRSAEIIKTYQKKYPNIIKPILQEENKYSQNIEVDFVYNFSRATGKYIAYCEGDDYWTDPNKLQKQINFMESHPEVSCCFHADKTINEAGDKVIGYRKAFKEDHYLTVEEAISLDGQFAHNSMVFVTNKIMNPPLPEWYFQAPVSDYPLLLILALQGKIYYMNEVMSAYRRASNNSWTTRILQVKEKREIHFQNINSMLLAFDDYSNFLYTTAIQEQILLIKFTLHRYNKNLKEIKTSKYSRLYNQLSLKDKSKLYIAYYFPMSIIINNWLMKIQSYYWFKPKEVFTNKTGL